MEAYVNGVSTRKVDFRNRPLEGEFPYLWLDAKQLKVRDRCSVRSKALVVARSTTQAAAR
jgi:transposase-like protein